ncbi:DUF2971 domain-containing protein [Nitrosomonas oligotropha]|uniref:DUF2971 domain-containing protein n=1 Tax=Nitrosomonas oligotropha TaxID=42354 RepID=UPI001371E3F0|nr:DUF2971 domain-containing protein [Nitrosomonas oligotropha]MXS83834.1 DUF2971 domain-containing protein [Nitrosomonas oligotropha]
MEENDDLIRKTLWDDYDNSKDYPDQRPLLAHYTSISTIEKIINSNELWLSNPLFMNDWEELRFGMNTGADSFRTNPLIANACGSTAMHSALMQAFDKIFHRFANDHAIDTYILCFSEHDLTDADGLLSMWRGYGEIGSGAALVIDTSKINAVEHIPLSIGRVHYATQSERISWIEKKINALADLIIQLPKSKKVFESVAQIWFERLLMFSLFTKHKGFSEEREWRLVYIKENDPEFIFSPFLSYSITAQGVHPKLKLKLSEFSKTSNLLPDFNIATLTDRILLGPSISSELSVQSFRRMLDLASCPLAHKVRASTIPFRP